MSSFLLYLDNKVLTKGAAFTNHSGQFYPINQNINGLSTYASPFGQLVSDFSIQGAQIPTGVFINGVFTPIGHNGLVDINYSKGQVYFSSPPNGVVTANYAIKDLNVVTPSVPHIQMLFDTKFELRSKTNQNLTGLFNNELTYPVIFIRQTSMKETPYAIGGQKKTYTNIGVYIFANSQFLLDATCGIISDLKYEYFPLLSAEVMPFNSYNGFRNGIPYNYTGLTQGYVPSGQGVLIENVVISDFSRRIYSEIQNLTPNCYFAIAEFDVFKDRVPQ